MSGGKGSVDGTRFLFIAWQALKLFSKIQVYLQLCILAFPGKMCSCRQLQEYTVKRGLLDWTQVHVVQDYHFP